MCNQRRAYWPATAESSPGADLLNLVFRQIRHQFFRLRLSEGGRALIAPGVTTGRSPERGQLDREMTRTSRLAVDRRG